MKTADFVALLAKETPAVDRKLRQRNIVLALVAALIVVFLVMISVTTINPQLLSIAFTVWFWVRFAFIASVAAIGWWAFARLGKPGVADRVAIWPLALPFVAIGVLGAWLLIQAPASERWAMILGTTWQVCSKNIALLSIPVFIVSIWIARQFAPTRLRLTGAALGFLSGALGALIYSLHCPELSPSFLSVWYTLGIVIPAVVGALLGRRLLSW
jgi:hypothetical protein